MFDCGAYSKMCSSVWTSVLSWDNLVVKTWATVLQSNNTLYCVYLHCQIEALWNGWYNWWNHMSILGWGHVYFLLAENASLQCEQWIFDGADNLVHLDCSACWIHSVLGNVLQKKSKHTCPTFWLGKICVVKLRTQQLARRLFFRACENSNWYGHFLPLEQRHFETCSIVQLNLRMGGAFELAHFCAHINC